MHNVSLELLEIDKQVKQLPDLNMAYDKPEYLNSSEQHPL